MALMTVDDALALILADIPAPAADEVQLAQARGRVLAAPLTASRDQPPFAASAMDGYALRSEDAVEGRTLDVVGTAQAGARFGGAIGAGTAVRIFTGAPVPDGATCVIMQEETERDGDRMTLRANGVAGQNIRTRGYDFAAGDTVLPAGRVLDAAALALAAAANHPTVRVSRRPRVAIAATGDELVAPGGTPGPDQIIASNSIGLAALVADWGGAPEDLGILPDDPAALTDAFSAALKSGVDVLLVSGGASVGAHDHVRGALEAAGVEIALWRIAMRPGKPMMFGRHGTTLVFGLPGNPVSAMVTARVMAVPALLALQGRDIPPPVQLPLAADLPANGARRNFVRSALTRGTDGKMAALPSRQTDSGHLSSLAQCDGFIDQASDSDAIPAGANVSFIPLSPLFTK